ncbi:MAG TPA: VOC family protein [Thermoanaerobaculia bacterium]|nr:VOC family protein [Thermoanaerobaculia bacterium]
MNDKPKTGAIVWTDLTVPDADAIRDFYSSVVGWRPEAVDMGGYSDYNMAGANGEPAAGVCWARGSNADLPAQWLVYVTVADLDASLAECSKRGGDLVAGPKSMGTHRYAVIRDPAGAVCALIEPAGE